MLATVATSHRGDCIAHHYDGLRVLCRIAFLVVSAFCQSRTWSPSTGQPKVNSTEDDTSLRALPLTKIIIRRALSTYSINRAIAQQEVGAVSEPRRDEL